MAESTTSGNTVTIEDAGPSTKKIHIEIPANAVDERLEESLDTLSFEAELPGFRKGRAPRRLIEKRFGMTVRNEAKSQLIGQAYQEAVQENEIKAIGEPVAEGIEDLQLEPGKALKFSLEVEVVPEFDLPELEGVEIKKPIIEVTEEMVADEEEKLQINDGTLEERDKAEAGDYLTGHGIMTDEDGTEHYNIEGCVVQVPPKDKDGKGMILGIIVDDLDKQLGTPNPGESVTVKATGPEHHEIEAIRGKKLTMTFKTERIDRIIPAPVESILSSYGFESEDQLKQAIRTRLDQRVAIEQASAMRAQVAKYLSENVEFDLPERLTASQANRTLERRRMELMYKGVSPQEIEEHMAELRASSQEAAAQELKQFFILHKAADDLEVKVEEAELNGYIARMAAERNVRPEKLRHELIQSNRIGMLFSQLREHKTLDAIVKKAKVEELSLEDYNRAMGKDDESKPAKKKSSSKKTTKKTTKKASSMKDD